MDPDDVAFRYDELSFFGENCAEYQVDVALPPPVERIAVPTDETGNMSALRWGSGPIDLVLCHGGAQNAHTWDTTLLAMLGGDHGLSAVALDLPGHGHSGWRSDGMYDPRSSADLIQRVFDSMPDIEGPITLVGMSLGGLVSICLAARHPDSVRRLVTIDITPGVNEQKASAVHDFIAGPQSFASFGEIFDRTVAFNPTRSPESLRRGILHNAHRLADGSWEWNYDRGHLGGGVVPAELWNDVQQVAAPYSLIRGGVSPVVDDEDVAELMRRQPQADVEVVAGAGHSVQGDAPIELAGLLSARMTQ